MKKHLFGLTLLCSTLLLQAEVAHYTLTVKTDGLKNSQGEVQFSLYNKDGSIPDKKLNQYFKTQRVEIRDKNAQVTFKDLPKGKYAVNIFHDENNNHKIDKGMIMPTEGVGLSNYKTINFINLPDFIKASFSLNHDQEIKIKVIYF